MWTTEVPTKPGWYRVIYTENDHGLCKRVEYREVKYLGSDGNLYFSRITVYGERMWCDVRGTENGGWGIYGWWHKPERETKFEEWIGKEKGKTNDDNSNS